MAPLKFHIVKLMFLVAQAAAWYIQITYCFTILPYSSPTKIKWVNVILVVLNYLIHIILTTLLHFSHWRTFLSDPGYVKSYFVYDRIKPENDDLEN